MPAALRPLPASLRALAKSLLVLAGAGATAVTLMACYGMPVCDTTVADAQLPDGGIDTGWCYRLPDDVTDGGLSDGGSTSDGGLSDGGH